MINVYFQSAFLLVTFQLQQTIRFFHQPNFNLVLFSRQTVTLAHSLAKRISSFVARCGEGENSFLSLLYCPRFVLVCLQEKACKKEWRESVIFTTCYFLFLLLALQKANSLEFCKKRHEFIALQDDQFPLHFGFRQYCCCTINDFQQFLIYSLFLSHYLCLFL